VTPILHKKYTPCQKIGSFGLPRCWRLITTLLTLQTEISISCKIKSGLIFWTFSFQPNFEIVGFWKLSQKISKIFGKFSKIFFCDFLQKKIWNGKIWDYPDNYGAQWRLNTIEKIQSRKITEAPPPKILILPGIGPQEFKLVSK
jgi:hypothetical protein